MNITIILPAVHVTSKRQQRGDDSPQPTTPFPPISITPSPTPFSESSATPTYNSEEYKDLIEEYNREIAENNLSRSRAEIVARQAAYDDVEVTRSDPGPRTKSKRSSTSPKEGTRKAGGGSAPCPYCSSSESLKSEASTRSRTVEKAAIVMNTLESRQSSTEKRKRTSHTSASTDRTTESPSSVDTVNTVIQSKAYDILGELKHHNSISSKLQDHFDMTSTLDDSFESIDSVQELIIVKDDYQDMDDLPEELRSNRNGTTLQEDYNEMTIHEKTHAAIMTAMSPTFRNVVTRTPSPPSVTPSPPPELPRHHEYILGVEERSLEFLYEEDEDEEESERNVILNNNNTMSSDLTMEEKVLEISNEKEVEFKDEGFSEANGDSSSLKEEQTSEATRKLSSDEIPQNEINTQEVQTSESVKVNEVEENLFAAMGSSLSRQLTEEKQTNSEVLDEPDPFVAKPVSINPLTIMHIGESEPLDDQQNAETSNPAESRYGVMNDTEVLTEEIITDNDSTFKGESNIEDNSIMEPIRTENLIDSVPGQHETGSSNAFDEIPETVDTLQGNQVALDDDTILIENDIKEITPIEVGNYNDDFEQDTISLTDESPFAYDQNNMKTSEPTGITEDLVDTMTTSESNVVPYEILEPHLEKIITEPVNKEDQTETTILTNPHDNENQHLGEVLSEKHQDHTEQAGQLQETGESIIPTEVREEISGNDPAGENTNDEPTESKIFEETSPTLEVAGNEEVTIIVTQDDMPPANMFER